MTTARLVFALVLSWLAVVIPWPALVAEAQTLDGMEGWSIVRVTP